MKHKKARMSAILSLLLVASMMLTGTQSAFAYSVEGEDTIHQGIIGYAMNVYQGTYTNTEVPDYLESIRNGARHEDEIDLIDDVLFGSVDICLTQSHFWDGDKGPGDPVDNVAACGFEVRNSWEKAQFLWGMALGRYRDGDKAKAYHYLGHVAHQLADQSVPAHAHKDAHPASEGGDFYEDWMTSDKAALTSGELTNLIGKGPAHYPDSNDPIWQLYYLFYSMNQIGDYFPSDDDWGSGDGDHYGNPDYGAWIENLLHVQLGLPEQNLDDLNWWNDEYNEQMAQWIREVSYFYAIRSTAALFDLFLQEASTHSALTVVIDQVLELEDHEGDIIGDHADYYVEVEIAGFEYRNEGEQNVDEDHIYPGWAFGRNVGVTGDILVVIQLFDEDDGNPDDPSAIDPVEGRRDLDLIVNLDTGVIREKEDQTKVIGNCGEPLVSEGHPNTDDRSRIWYRILLPNIPPTAEAGDDQTVNEGDIVTLSGTYTDPNEEDTHTFLWELVSSNNGQTVPDSHMQYLNFTPEDDGVYKFRFTVTDNFGASGSDDVVVTSLNVPPEASIDSLTDELGAEIGVDVPVALVGLEVNLEGSFTDAGLKDTHTAEINWDDGTIDPETAFYAFIDSTNSNMGLLYATHIYTVPGDYNIVLTVTDDDEGSDTQTIPIEIVDAAGAIEYVVESLEQHADNPDIQAALDKMIGEQDGDASNGAIDMLEQGNLNAALEKIKQALEYMEAAEAADPNLDLTYDKGLLALAAKSVAVGAIAEATAAANSQNDPLKIQEATALVAEGDLLLMAPDYVGAVDKYQKAVRRVQGTS